jgi:predicted enzyme related to lactoylglutathione lyase
MTMLRGMATASYFADDLDAAARWYGELLGIEPYYAVHVCERCGTRQVGDPRCEGCSAQLRPAYVEFRVGEHQHELGLIDNRWAPHKPPARPGGVVLFWHVDDVSEVLERVLSMGAVEHEPLTRRQAGWITASVVDPFGNILGLVYNPLQVELMSASRPA